jgi:hypothetical protein
MPGVRGSWTNNLSVVNFGGGPNRPNWFLSSQFETVILKKLPELGSDNMIFTLKTFSHGVAPYCKIVQSPAQGVRENCFAVVILKIFLEHPFRCLMRPVEKSLFCDSIGSAATQFIAYTVLSRDTCFSNRLERRRGGWLLNSLVSGIFKPWRRAHRQLAEREESPRFPPRIFVFQIVPVSPPLVNAGGAREKTSSLPCRR